MKKGGAKAKQLNSRPNAALWTAACMLFLVLLSFWSLSGLLARYTAAGEESNSARVASFDVSASGSGDTLSFDVTQEERAEYRITLRNRSEVKVAYDVVLTFPEELPEGIEVTLDGQRGSVSGDGKIRTFSQVGTLAALSGEAANVLTFTADADVFASGITGADFEKSMDFDVTVNFVQVD